MKRTSKSIAALVPLVALLAAACGDEAEPSASSAVPVLDGRTFLLSETAGSVEGDHTLVAGSVVRLAFADGAVSAQAGCNSMGGGYALDGDVLRVEQLAQTQMACDEALMDQDAWLAEFLSAAPTIGLSGDELTLTGEADTLVLVDRVVADPDRALEGTTWTVDGLVSADAVSSVPTGVVATILIEEGKVHVVAGCNTGNGTVEIDEAAGVLTFGPIATTKMMCDEDQMLVEQAVLATLVGEVAYEIEAASLTLTNGDAGLNLRTEEAAS